MIYINASSLSLSLSLFVKNGFHYERKNSTMTNLLQSIEVLLSRDLKTTRTPNSMPPYIPIQLSNMMTCYLLQFPLFIVEMLWHLWHCQSPQIKSFFSPPACKSEVKPFHILELNPQYRNDKKITWKRCISSIFSIHAKTQLKEDRLTSVKDIHPHYLSP